MKIVIQIILFLFSLFNKNNSYKIKDNTSSIINYSNKTTVCLSGDLSNYDEDNLLLDGFHYSDKYEGIYKIADRNNTKLIIPKTATYKVSFVFTDSIENFDKRNRLNYYGFSLSINRDNKEIKEDYLYKIDFFKDLFIRNGNYYNQNFNSVGSKIDLKASGESYSSFFILTIKLSLIKNDRLNFFNLYYSDNPFYIKNIVLSNKNISNDILIKQKDNKLKCDVKKEYVENNTNINLNVDYGRKISLNYLLYNFVKYDNSNEEFITFDDYLDSNNYFSNCLKAKIGSRFKLILYYSLSSIRTSLNINLIIVDSLAPTIKPILNDEIKCSYSENFNSLIFINKYFEITDNYSSSIKVKIVDEKDNEIENKLGKIKAKIIASDSFNNKSECLFTLNLIDDIPPIIESAYSHIYLNKSYKLEYTDIIDMFSSIDRIDGKCPVKIIENNYMSKEEEIKKSIIKVESKDSSLNASYLTLNIDVKENYPICFIGENKIKIIKSNNIIKNEFILSILKESKQVEDTNYDSHYFENNTDLNKLDVGTYKLKFYIVKNNIKKDINLDIEIENLDEKKETNKSFSEKFIDFFKNIFNKISEFFSNLFK